MTTASAVLMNLPLLRQPLALVIVRKTMLILMLAMAKIDNPDTKTVRDVRSLTPLITAFPACRALTKVLEPAHVKNEQAHAWSAMAAQAINEQRVILALSSILVWIREEQLVQVDTFKIRQPRLAMHARHHVPLVHIQRIVA